MAVAHEQEMIAAVQEMRARVVEAEAEVPRAMAEALRQGKLGVMDYYNMQNVISDTRMRESIAGADATVAKPIDETNGKNTRSSVRHTVRGCVPLPRTHPHNGGEGRVWTLFLYCLY